MIETTQASATDQLIDAVREFLRAHPAASRSQLLEGVEGSRSEITAAFEELIESGEAEYIAPERPGQPGRCSLLDVDPDSDNPPGALWTPATRCTGCHRGPPVRFTGREVSRARRERQSARIQMVRCPHCRTTYWIQARHVARATLDRSAQIA